MAKTSKPVRSKYGLMRDGLRRRCRVCREWKDEQADFSSKGSGLRRSECKECRKKPAGPAPAGPAPAETVSAATPAPFEKRWPSVAALDAAMEESTLQSEPEIDEHARVELADLSDTASLEVDELASAQELYMNLKTCTRCQQEKPLEAFGAKGVRGQYAQPQCKECRCVPPRPVVDDGFEIHAVTSQVDPSGELQMQSIKTRTEREVHAGVHESLPSGHKVKGVSTLVDQSGNVVQQWIKTTRNDERMEHLLSALATVSEAWTGINAAAVAPMPLDQLDDDLLAVYPLGDPHFGMYAWAAETGESFDLRIAEQHTVAAIDHLVASAPPAARAIVVSVGDTSHGDNNSNQTSKSHHTLDVDTRWGKVMRVIIRSLRRCTDKALSKHAQVDVVIVPGNHDDHSAAMIALCLAQFYEHEPRVHVDTSPNPFLWFRHGKCLLGFVHGHMTKMNDLPEIMACDRPTDWAETEHRHWYTGHVHHDTHKDFRGCSAETLRILAPRDSWHHSKGYRSMQDSKCDIWHKLDGRIQRNVVSIAAVRRTLNSH
jgi:hypothetical protein